ncbi:hypothetical protein [Pseudomonas kurunegalensis]|uniref:hypothetical protein n=1 Tax=Pseudomonas kurunegalensis TaxID=485880 RepID=UPI00256FEE9E|nr:hypothetical protein [Pseudomonas kurunegalensis]WJD60667.1 hypothetical protein QQ992_17180 [Pseudomonas kurunegalensis]
MVMQLIGEFDLGFEHCVGDRFTAPPSLRALLYCGGSAAHGFTVEKQISSGLLGALKPSRLELVRLLHGYIVRRLDNGYSEWTTKRDITAFKVLYSHYDALGVDITVGNVCELYEKYSYDKAYDIDINNRKEGTYSAYTVDRILVRVIESMLELSPRSLKSSFNYTSLKRRGLIARAKNDTGSINAGFQYGADLLDVIDSLSYEACFGELPLQVSFTDGAVIEHWARMKTPDKLLGPEGRDPYNVKGQASRREENRLHGTVRTRSPLINLRIDAEFNFFVAQTGMNASDAYDLPMADYRYSSWEGDYRVSAYKDRRKGDVEFFIYKEYREIFDEYLAFIRRLYPDGCEYLFPFIKTNSKKRADAYSQARMKKLFSSVDKKCINLRSLRNRRVNWMLRETHDPVLSALMAQHTTTTMFRSYVAPNHSIATREFSGFFAHEKTVRDSVAKGRCTSEIKVVAVTDSAPIKPDCINPAGCLFCEHYQGIRSLDYIWSMASYHYLKNAELARLPLNKRAEGSPQKAIVDRLNALMNEFEAQGGQCNDWVVEARLRISELDFHHSFRGMIEVLH